MVTSISPVKPSLSASFAAASAAACRSLSLLPTHGCGIGHLLSRANHKPSANEIQDCCSSLGGDDVALGFVDRPPSLQECRRFLFVTSQVRDTCACEDRGRLEVREVGRLCEVLCL